MHNIKMVDLGRQYQRLKDDIDNAMQQVITTTAFIKGPEVEQLEEQLCNYLNVKHTIGCGNGTDALQLALMALDLSPGDEVITSNFTFIATVEVIALLGLKPVLVDVDPHTFNLDTAQVKKAITPQTKAIVPVHLFGQCADMDTLCQLAREHNIYIIEDGAQSIGAEYTFANGEVKKASAIGDIGTTSFFPSKNLGAFGDGGAVFTNNDVLAAKIRSVANHGMSKRYHYNHIGINSRLDTLQAAILTVKLKQLDDFNRRRQAAADYYDHAFAANNIIQVPHRSLNSTHVFHQYTLRIKKGDRNKLQEYLKNKSIPSMIYYPVPLHTQEAYNRYAFNDNNFPVTKMLCEQVLSLPMHTELTIDELDFITEAVNEFLTN